MKYVVDLTPTAESELVSAFHYIRDRAPENARRWLEGVHTAIESLETMPHRCSAAREAEYLNEPLKQFLFKSHRIIFFVDEVRHMVRVLSIRHQAQEAIGEETGDSEE